MMKTFTTRLLVVAGLVGIGASGLLTSTTGCGSSSTSTGGTGGKGGGTGGGSGGSGGGTGGGGSGGSGGNTDASVTHTLSYTFDSTTQGFVLNDFDDTTSINLASKTLVDAGARDGGTLPTLVQDSTDGNPATPPGSLKVSVTFTALGQYVDVIINPPSPGIDLTGKTLHAKVRLTSGAFSGGAQFHASTGDFSPYGLSPVPPLTLGVWNDVSLDISGQAAANWDPTKVVQIGVQFFTGSTPSTDAGNGYANAGTPVTFSIDTITD